MARRSMWRNIDASRKYGRVLLSNPALHAVIGGLVVFGIVNSLGLGGATSFLISITLIYGIAAFGLDVIVGLFGQISLGQGASVGVGAYVAAILSTEYAWPIIPALTASLLAGALVGLLVGAPATRLGSVGLGVVTLGCTLILGDLVTGLPVKLAGGPVGIVGIEAPMFTPHGPVATIRQLYLLIIVFFGAAYVAHWYLRQSGFGRAALAIKNEPIGAAGLGIRLFVRRIVGFSAGSALGALAGGLYAYDVTTVSPGAFGVSLSLLLLLMVIFGGSGTRIGPVFGIAIVGSIPSLLQAHPSAEIYIYGTVLILTVRFLPRGVLSHTAAPLGWRASRRLDASLPGLPGESKGRDGEGLRSDAEAEEEPVLTVSHVSRSFGAVRALHDASLRVGRGEVVAVIGPNGSGKTTLLNVICGFYRADSGEIRVGPTEVTQASTGRISSLGVARTFQVPKIFPDLSIREHLALAQAFGDEAAQAESVWSQAEPLLARCGLSGKRLDGSARGLAHGQLRFLEIVMASLRRPQLIMLDEPAAGLSAGEMELLGGIVSQMSAAGTGVLLVEHHVEWVREVADKVVVMADGEILFDGSPHNFHLDEDVKAAYLGTRAEG